MKIGVFVFSGLLLIFLNGCYTQFATMDRELIPKKQYTMIDPETGDTVRVIHRVDTVERRDREICVWERDLAGFPRLRCFRSNYSKDWYHFNNLPWWYRTSPYFRDYDICPPYYYFDYRTRTCRYVGVSPPPTDGTIPPESDTSSHRPARRSSTSGLQGAEPVQSESSGTGTGTPVSPAPLIRTDNPTRPVERESATSTGSASSGDSDSSDKKEDSEPVRRRNPRRF
ncbi:hypothetical protein CHISP_2450 [Chitinispirillum alkaliphilum]|nr:hypothetical protein CHISP_2450 [Chitinispirillum alkaliphilum]